MKIERPFWIHFTSLTSLTSLTHSLTFTSQALASLAFGSGGGGRRRGEMASSLTIKESFKGKYSTCKTSAGVNPASIFQRNPFKNFFHSIFFPGKSLVKNSKLTFNFTWKSPIKFFLHFLQGNPFIIFPKNYFWDHFSKTLSKRVFLKIL